MSEDIKEILNKWKCYIGLTKKFTTSEYEMLRVEDIDKILDYITNLQNQLQQKENIIKEVREYIEENAYWAEETEDGDFVSGKLLHDDDITYIEELLDKENT